ncbi:Putative ferric reductase, NAD binding domain, ferric reductase transmembrane component-like protein [Septoria linicola]|uniref:ferric-chelate reductase (NADPH) n=1 Tax=Septoria linicola TaxID=215465 RepID=A0A9Q9AVW4_9PEZI|nr:Putative ferric reductase, NAD binding domain, ferric reductase transmembrane component-like protein [Septoria linicola]
MSMSGMSHGSHSMSGMTMSGGMFTPSDETYAQAFWYAIAGGIALLTITKAASTVQSRRRLKQHKRDPTSIPSRPTGPFAQAFATATALTREMTYSQPLYFTGRISRYFTPLPLGRWLLLAIYWIIILAFLWTDTILTRGDPIYPDSIYFLLSCKFNPISLLTGISYERFNWLHRWAARTMWVTAIVHWSFFYTEWSLAGIVGMQMDMMPMVRYGFGAWGVVTWMLLSGFGLFRDLCYELFVLQHIAAAGTLLWLLFVHVPSYARYNVWLSVAFVAFDWGVRIIWGITRNLHLLKRSGSKSPGYTTHLEALPGNVTRLTIDSPDFAWQAGQHAYLYMPSLRPFEFHPFTIASTSSSGKMSMLIQSRSGFSKSLHKSAAAAGKPSSSSWRNRAFISGPWGSPPDLSSYDTVVLIACSTGATFILPILQDLLQKETCIRNITLHWIIREEEHFAWVEQDLQEAVKQTTEGGKLRLKVVVHVTGSSALPSAVVASNPPTLISDKKPTATTRVETHRKPASSFEESSSLDSIPSASTSEHSPLTTKAPPSSSSSSSMSITHGTRPSIPSLILPSVAAAWGESGIIVCGGPSITAETRTYVAKLSDERAVHKGTGAQGIYLFSETYGW